MRKLILFCAVVLLCSSNVFAGTIRHVPAEYPTIQTGIDAAVNGDTVLVADGTYTGDGNHDIDFKGKAITVKSEHGPTKTIVDADLHERVFVFKTRETRNSKLSGFTIKRGLNGILIGRSSPTITNCYITECMNVPFGGGILAYRSGALITNCKIFKNVTNPYLADSTEGDVSAHGAGIYCQGSVTISNCLIYDNWAADGGKDLESYGAGLYYLKEDPPGKNPKVTNCTIWGNHATEYKDFTYRKTQNGDVPLMISNSIIGDFDYGKILFETTHSFFATIHSDTDPPFIGEGNIVGGDPLFVNAGKFIFRLRSGSPCINTGDNDYAIGAKAFGNTPRILDGVVDMGAYEYNP